MKSDLDEEDYGNTPEQLELPLNEQVLYGAEGVIYQAECPVGVEICAVYCESIRRGQHLNPSKLNKQ